jgi:hypothetical protein
MKKVRVLKDMPFAEVGEEIELSQVGSMQYVDAFGERLWRYGDIAVEGMVKDGWIEWVEEEKSLEDKFRATKMSLSKDDIDYLYGLACMARKHENKRYLRVIDEIIINRESWQDSLDIIRQAIKKAGEEE